MRFNRFAIPVLVASLAPATLAIRSTWNAGTATHASAPESSQNGTPATPQAPSAEEIRERSAKLIQNQHHDDEALEQYERIEHEFNRTSGMNPRVLAEKMFRVVPNGFGTFKLPLKTDGIPPDAVEYHRELLAWKDSLDLALRPDDWKYKAASAKWQKKKHDRAELIDASRNAFVTKWVGQETRNGRWCDVLELEPNPTFHPHSLLQEVLTRVTVKIWVDHETNQLARGEAHVFRDISVGGGIFGKLYRGGVFSLEQSEVAPGVWLPARYQYDFTGRKFLFTFEEHQYFETSRYRRLGPPKQALEFVQNELASGKTFNGDP
jgi:hypothetical protein